MHAHIAAPLLFGEAAAWAAYHTFSPRRFTYTLAWALLAQLFVGWTNDFADHVDDTGERSLFSGGSGVIREGRLAPRAVGSAALLAALALGLLSFWLLRSGRPYAAPAWSTAVGLMWAYSLPPLCLSYRGGGEWVYALGVGVGLPWLGFYVQSGVGLPPPWAVAPVFFLAFAAHVATTLPDAAVDAAQGKRTLVVRLGARRARAVGIGTTLVALGVGSVLLPLPFGVHLAVVAIATLPLAMETVALMHWRSGDPPPCVRYVLALTAAIYVCLAGWSLGLMLR